MIQQPYIIEVDSRLIKFNQENPRSHQGSSFVRLKQSIKETGMVQFPTVRVLPGGFYEVIDGEGRVRAAQEEKSAIWVVNLGIMNDQEALSKLEASNTVRSFGFLAECRGMATMHKGGMDAEQIAKKLGLSSAAPIRAKISIGYFPEKLIQLIEEDDRAHADGRTNVWGEHFLRVLLPLRQFLPGKTSELYTAVSSRRYGHADAEIPREGIYNYTEVERAIRKTIAGDITNEDQLRAYAETRRRELFEERFSQELREQLDVEISKTKQQLEESYAQKLQGAEQQTAKRYADQVAVLQKQYDDLAARNQQLIRDVAKRPEIIEQREAELQKKLREAEDERARFTTLQMQVQKEIETARIRAEQEAQKAREEARAAIQSQLGEAIKEQRRVMDEQFAKTKVDLESYYAQRDGERQLKAETSLRQAIAHGKELLSQTQQSFLHLTAPGYLKGISWLSDAEIAGLLAEIMVVQQTLDDSRQHIQETMRSRGSETVSAQTHVIEERG